MDLLDVDGRRIRDVAAASQRAEPIERTGSPTQNVDQDGRIENDAQSADALLVAPTLGCDPALHVLIPRVGAVIEPPDRAFDRDPSPLVLQGACDCTGDERAALPAADTTVELGDQIVVQAYVQTHVRKLAHRATVSATVQLSSQ